MEAASHVAGPPVRETDYLVPLMPFAKTMGFEIPLYTTQETWELYVRHGPYALCSKLGNVVSNALATAKADRQDIDFTWRYSDCESDAYRGRRSKEKRVRMRVSLYQTAEGIPWVLLQFRNGRSIA